MKKAIFVVCTLIASMAFSVSAYADTIYSGCDVSVPPSGTGGSSLGAITCRIPISYTAYVIGVSAYPAVSPSSPSYIKVVDSAHGNNVLLACSLVTYNSSPLQPYLVFPSRVLVPAGGQPGVLFYTDSTCATPDSASFYFDNTLPGFFTFGTWYWSSDTPIAFQNILFPVVYSSTTQQIAASSSLWADLSLNATTTLSQTCQTTNNPIDYHFYSGAACVSFNFLFVPDPNILNQFLVLFSTSSPTSLEARVPFSYFYDSVAILSGLQASTTQMVTWTIPFHSIGLGSTTPMGNFLPDVTILSSSTITYWIGLQRWNELQVLLIATLYLGMAYTFWRQAKYLAAKHH